MSAREQLAILHCPTNVNSSQKHTCSSVIIKSDKKKQQQQQQQLCLEPLSHNMCTLKYILNTGFQVVIFPDSANSSSSFVQSVQCNEKPPL